MICEEEMDDTGESERKRETDRRGVGGGRRRGGGGAEGGRKRDEMRQGYRDERKTSLSLHFFNIPSS